MSQSVQENFVEFLFCFCNKHVIIAWFFQSMSDESSMGSPRMKTPGLKSKPVHGNMPWWAEEDDEDEDKRREAARQSWIKPKIPEQEEKKQEPDAVDDVRIMCILWYVFICYFWRGGYCCF